MVRNRLLKKAIISFEEYERLVKDGVQKDILEQRIDKAIEYMKNYIKVEPLNEPVKVEFKEVINILKGD